MSWDAMVQSDTNLTRILTDHQPALTAIEDHLWQTRGVHRFGVSYRQGVRDATRQVIGWVLHLQRAVDDLTVAELIGELRKRDASVYWPLFETDPKVWLLCDHCRTRQLFDAEGICPNCEREIAP